MAVLASLRNAFRHGVAGFYRMGSGFAEPILRQLIIDYIVIVIIIVVIIIIIIVIVIIIV